MPARIAAATDKLGCATRRRPRALSLVTNTTTSTLMLLALLLTTSPLYVTIIRGEAAAAAAADASVVAGAKGDGAHQPSHHVGSLGSLSALPNRLAGQHQQLEHPQQEQRKDTVLSRRRRYLVFPQDSSLNLVFDEVIPIVDYTLYVVTGQTLALAWELPHRPIVLEDMFMPPAEAAPVVEPVAAPAVAQPLRPVIAPVPVVRRKDSYYFGGSQNRTSGPSRPQWPMAVRPPSKAYYNYGDRFYAAGNRNSIDRFDDERLLFTRTTTTTTTTTTADPNAGRDIIISENYPFNRKRPIYAMPVGKRSVNDASSRPENLAERHHRHSRYDLYRLIEIYLTANGHDGAACVLQTLCEVGQHRRSGAQLGSFVTEIVRAIFRLPGENRDDSNPASGNSTKYHEAHSQPESCSEMFSGCGHSIWTASFF